MPRALKMSELLAYAQQMAKKYHLDIASPEFSSARQVGGHGTHLKRRRTDSIPYELKLKIEIQERTCEVYYCAPFIVDGTAYTVQTITIHYVNGNKVYVSTQPSIGPHIYNPDSEERFSCPVTDNTDNVDPGFDYGASTGDPDTIAYTGPVSASGLLTTALANLADWGSPSYALDLTWMSDADIPSYSDVQLGYWTEDPTPYTGRAAFSFKYRWVNLGPALSLAWTQGGNDETLDLPANTTSDWYDDDLTALAIGDFDRITELVITF